MLLTLSAIGCTGRRICICEGRREIGFHAIGGRATAISGSGRLDNGVCSGVGHGTGAASGTDGNIGGRGRKNADGIAITIGLCSGSAGGRCVDKSVGCSLGETGVGCGNTIGVLGSGITIGLIKVCDGDAGDACI